MSNPSLKFLASSPSFTYLATVSASTKKPPASEDGQRGGVGNGLSGLKCLPLQGVQPEVAMMYAAAMGMVFWTAVQGSPDIEAGDVLVVGDKEYPIRSAEKVFSGDDGEYSLVSLFVEEIKTPL